MPARARDRGQVTHAVRGSTVDIVESRAPVAPGATSQWTSNRVARLRRGASGRWLLYLRGRNDRLLDCRDAAEVGTLLVDLLAELDADPTCVFWG